MLTRAVLLDRSSAGGVEAGPVSGAGSPRRTWHGRAGPLAVLAAALALWIAVSLPAALGEVTFYFRDLSYLFIRIKAFGAAELAAGRIPATNPTWALGQAFRGDPNATAFYPSNPRSADQGWDSGAGNGSAVFCCGRSVLLPSLVRHLRHRPAGDHRTPTRRRAALDRPVRLSWTAAADRHADGGGALGAQPASGPRHHQQQGCPGQAQRVAASPSSELPGGKHEFWVKASSGGQNHSDSVRFKVGN